MNIISFVLFVKRYSNEYLRSVNQANNDMKYNELERLLKKAGCFNTGEQQNGHPVWESPKTGKRFRMSNHGKQEVATGTLKAIMKAAGLN